MTRTQVRLKAEKQKRDITEAFDRMKAKGHFDVSCTCAWN